MGTGAAGLSGRESFEIILDVLIKDQEAWIPHVSTLYLSCDELTSIKEIDEFAAYAQARLSKLPVQVTSESNDRPLGSSEGEMAASEAIEGAHKHRVIQDDSETQVDATSGRPGMGFDHIASQLVRIVSDISAASQRSGNKDAKSIYTNLKEARLTVGIFAPWGAGKSTLIRELHRQFRGAGHLVVVINPWKWTGNGDLHDYVRDQVIQQFSDHGSEVRLARLKLRRFGRAYGRWIWVALILLLMGGITGPKLLPIATKLTANSGDAWSELLGRFGLSDLAPFAVLVAPRALSWLSKTINNWLHKGREKSDINIGAAGLSLAYQDIAQLLLQEGELKPFVFFFDDLDRCGPEKVALVLESVHSLTAAGCVVFLACDDEYVEAAINAHYEKIATAYANGSSFGRRFLDKIVQISFRLPLVRAEHIFELNLATRPISNGQSGQPPLQLSAANTTSPTGVAGTISSTNGSEGLREHMKLDETQLRNVIGELLENAVETLGLNVRQVKSVSNTLKLYLGITGISTEQEARRLAAFVFADKFDRGWLDALYFETSREGTAIGSTPALDEVLSAMIGPPDDGLLSLYHLLGRRPKPKQMRLNKEASPMAS
jgi:hypothetical protein